MSSPESFSNRARDPEQRRQALDDLNEGVRRNWQSLIIGAFLGLLLGLFIGWVLWPVQYTTAWPNELAPEAKAQYIAAVADAYAAARSETAAQVAQQRLAWFGAETAAEVAVAQQFFEQSDLPDTDIRVTNIEDLAYALDPSSATVDLAAGEPLPAEDVTPVLTVPSDDQVTQVSEGMPEWLGLMLWMLAAFVLIAGGIWVLRTVMRAPPVESDTTGEDEIDEFDESDYVQPAEADRSGEVVGAAPLLAELDEPGNDDGSAMSGIGSEDEPSAHEDRQSADDPVTEEEPRNVSVRSGSAGAVISSVALADPDGYGFEPEPEHTQPPGSNSTTIFAEAERDDIVPSEEDSERDADPADGTMAMEGEAEALALSDSASQRAVVSGPEVARFTAHFLPDLAEYEEAFVIEDQAGYISDCGMGVNMKQGLVRHNPEHVTVLDVWLVDLAQGANRTYRSVSLVSKHGVEGELPQELAEGDDLAQLVLAPEASETFQIVGQNLVVDCEVAAVRYAVTGEAKGVFTECKVEMVVSRR